MEKRTRNDVKVKAVLKAAGIALIKWGGHKNAPRLVRDGVEVTQQHGEVVITTHGWIGKDEVEKLVSGLGIKYYIY